MQLNNPNTDYDAKYGDDDSENNTFFLHLSPLIRYYRRDAVGGIEGIELRMGTDTDPGGDNLLTHAVAVCVVGIIGQAAGKQHLLQLPQDIVAIRLSTADGAVDDQLIVRAKICVVIDVGFCARSVAFAE